MILIKNNNLICKVTIQSNIQKHKLNSLSHYSRQLTKNRNVYSSGLEFKTDSSAKQIIVFFSCWWRLVSGVGRLLVATKNYLQLP